MERIVKEVTKVQLLLININRDERLQTKPHMDSDHQDFKSPQYKEEE
jgi:hypothetical protein